MRQLLNWHEDPAKRAAEKDYLSDPEYVACFLNRRTDTGKRIKRACKKKKKRGGWEGRERQRQFVRGCVHVCVCVREGGRDTHTHTYTHTHTHTHTPTLVFRWRKRVGILAKHNLIFELHLYPHQVARLHCHA